MAIGTGDSVDKFGTQDTVTVAGGTSSVTSGSFSASGDVVSGGWTNTDDAIKASVTGKFAFSTAPDAYSSIDLYARLLNIDSTNDQDTPDANYLHVYLGSFPLNDVTTTQYISIEISLPNAYTSQVYEFYIQNNGGQTLSAGWTLKVTPKAIGPA